MPGSTAVILPGTGSDEVFVRSVFAAPLASLGIELVAPPPPTGGDVVAGYLELLDRCAATAPGPVLAGGISLGAHVATEWALRAPERCAGVLAALPAWNGDPGAAPAALAARASAELVEREGLDAALAMSTAGIAPWLAAELDRAWRGHGEGLSASLRSAAAHRAPELDRLRELDVPVGIAACADDPVHPAAVADAWAAALPRASVCATTLSSFGTDREALGRAALLALLRAVTEERAA
ncbi:alpha/beta fold hydrolase [Prauserella cavernicola]|uniref:Alpha/beta hydrolase n=1 Tax=Prauserella cavernicola TaxID=2800127 RepID=A0A934V8X4_9PSEU|nr:alpha/beta hydrolase [Prauserella cavernicola]MBK1788740.1 alpha/beta hydrolase [Prauserella cavernicola]